MYFFDHSCGGADEFDAAEAVPSGDDVCCVNWAVEMRIKTSASIPNFFPVIFHQLLNYKVCFRFRIDLILPLRLQNGYLYFFDN